MVRGTSCSSRVAADHDNVKVSTAVFTVLFSRVFALNVLSHVPYLGKVSNEFTARCSSLPNQDQCPSWEIPLSLPRYSHDPLLARSNIKMICRSCDSANRWVHGTSTTMPQCCPNIAGLSQFPKSALIARAPFDSAQLRVLGRPCNSGTTVNARAIIFTEVYTVLFNCAIAGVCQLCTPFVEACSSLAVNPTMMQKVRTAAWTANRWVHGTSTTMPQCCQIVPG